MFNTIFWILAIWFVVNVIWMWFQLDNQTLQKHLLGLMSVLSSLDSGFTME